MKFKVGVAMFEKILRVVLILFGVVVGAYLIALLLTMMFIGVGMMVCFWWGN